jgi:hypothetical protein
MAGHCPIFYQDPLRTPWPTEVAGQPDDAQLPRPLVPTGEYSTGRVLDHVADAVGVCGKHCPRWPLLLLDDMPDIVAFEWRETIPALERRAAPSDARETAPDLLQGIRIEARASDVPEDRRKLNFREIALTARRQEDDLIGICVHPAGSVAALML